MQDAHLMFPCDGEELNVVAKKRSGLSISEPDRPYGQLNGRTEVHQTNVKVKILCVEIEVGLAGVPAGSVKDQASVANTQLDRSVHRVAGRDVVLKAGKVNGPTVLLDVNVRGDGIGRVWIGVGVIVAVVEPKMVSRVSHGGLAVGHQLGLEVEQLQLSNVRNHPPLVDFPGLEPAIVRIFFIPTKIRITWFRFACPSSSKEAGGLGESQSLQKALSRKDSALHT